ncbi:MAG: dTDP-4-dehydrorhamnose reductase [Candidatus Gracilibacteria bacterium]|jgi:dTDP-4-dehydrorhamnose reductase|nr:dTDP-4-dehydrorhamnose reductase [Candidatus Gracilibacteria bacterium]
MTKKILIFGSQGILGFDLYNVLSEEESYQIIPFSRYNLDLHDLEKIKPTIENINPDIVINASGFTNTEKAEDENFQEQVELLNIHAPAEMAKACNKLKTRFIHFSTDFIFDGKNGEYHEESEPNPLNFYGKSKADGEKTILKINPEVIIIRTAWLFGKNGPSFIQNITNIAQKKQEIEVVDDIIVSMTSSLDLARAVKSLIDKDKFEYNIYHFVNEGEHSLYEITEQIFEIKKIKTKLIPVSSSRFPSKVNRPKKAILKNTRHNKLPHLKEALKEFLSPND